MNLEQSSRTDPTAWRLLFVDDEQPVLDGLRRMLRPMRHSRDMERCCDAEVAARRTGQGGIDVLVTDMRMPAMDGLQLLHEVSACSPGTLRIVLSGHADRNAAIRSIGLVHQFLAKPWWQKRCRRWAAGSAGYACGPRTGRCQPDGIVGIA